MNNTSDLPEFRKPKAVVNYSSPEELFSKLPNRAGSHGYLRVPQADVLRLYKDCADKDIALELPTGTGKTAVGLLIAEWRRRRSGEKVAYLVLTNQLAKQVMREAKNLGIECADLTGNKDSRDQAEVSKYNLAKAVAVSTYSNLFNVNPVIQESDVLVLDDAHGAESFVSGMWTVRVRKDMPNRIYSEVLTAIRPSLTDTQYRIVTDEDEFEAVELADIHASAGVVPAITALFDRVRAAEISFPWNLIRNHLQACVCLVSTKEIVIRPVVPPTHTHAPFADTNQRIYMSATLGGQGDLQRSYGITSIKPIRARHAEWGKRYVFVPGICHPEQECFDLVVEVWKGIEPRRALLLAPSFPTADKMFTRISTGMNPPPARFGASDIEESLEPFTLSVCGMLCLAGRYDGIDLPGDTCRLLIISETAAAIDALERHMRDHWKMGPLLRRRERTRLIQGMGRCTRDATDFAVVIMLGQSLLNALTTSALIQGFPEEIQRELKWGMEQSDLPKEQRHQLSQMIIALLTDPEYRRQANESLEEITISSEEEIEDPYSQGAIAEVKYLRALWEGDYTHAQGIAHGQGDCINHPELSGYRAWWWYLAGVATFHLGDTAREIDYLKRARATRINSGFLDHLMRARNLSVKTEPSEIDDIRGESVWTLLEKWGWQGPGFAAKLNEMLEGLNKPEEPTQFNIGLERLGECFGAKVFRLTEPAVPDVVWVFHDCCYAIESKSDKKADGVLSKNDLQQTKGHSEWVIAHILEAKNIPIKPVVVASVYPNTVAEPFIGGIFHVLIEDIVKEAKRVASEFSAVRARFSGKEYSSAQGEFRIAVKIAGLGRETVEALFSKPLRVKH